MKNVFKCFGLVLVLMLLFSSPIVKASGSTLTFISSQAVTDTITYAIGRAEAENNNYAKGRCLQFVTECWTHTYGNDWPIAKKCCAYTSWNSFKKSTSLNDIPIGATVYFKDVSKTPTYCGGHAAGHAGIYIGYYETIDKSTKKPKTISDAVVHVWSGKIKISSIKDIVNCNYKYLGWGYPSGVKIETEPPSKANSRLTINLTSYPTKLTVGSSYGLRGSITSNYKIEKISGTILNGSKVMLSIETTKLKNTSTSINIADSVINNELKFAYIPASNTPYTLVIAAQDSSGKKITVSKNFVVTTIDINLTSIPSTVTYGKSFGLRGDITSVNKITKVCGSIKTTSGATKLSSIDYPNAKSMNIRYSNLNNNLIFKKLPVGSYVLEIKALDNKGYVQISTYNFKVKK